MLAARMTAVFLGLESPSDAALEETGKRQNPQRSSGTTIEAARPIWLRLGRAGIFSRPFTAGVIRMRESAQRRRSGTPVARVCTFFAGSEDSRAILARRGVDSAP
jgi:hypothetical protein